MEETEKTCARCSITQGVDEFWVNKKKLDGRDIVCRTCRSEEGKKEYAKDKTRFKKKNRKYYEANREDIIANTAKWREDNPGREGDWVRSHPEVALRSAAKIRAKNQGCPFTITKKDIFIPKYCPILGIKLEHNRGSKGPVDGSPSLDKIIPGLGYVPGNVAVISHRANRLKSDGNIEELELLLVWLKAHAARTATVSGAEQTLSEAA
jgi:hypothetical protein